MNPAFLVFLAIAIPAGIATIAVVTTRSVLHAALGLAGALLASAGLFIFFGAEFAGLVQVLVYVGAVVVLFLFGIMLTSSRGNSSVVDNDQRWVAALVALGLFGLLSTSIVATFGGQTLELKHAFPVAAIGTEIFTTWVLPFEAVSVLLLAALIGAIVLARRD